MGAYLEIAISWLLSKAKGNDAKAFTKGPAFALCPNPTMDITSLDCGADGAVLGPEYMRGGGSDGGRAPALRWDSVVGVQQWMLICEDLDAPIPKPICHGLYLGISPFKTHIECRDLELEDGNQSTRLKGGFCYGKNWHGSIYIPPRPLLNHGTHRYFFFVVALKEPLDAEFVASKPTREQVKKAIEGKVLAWGRWVGQCERKYR